MDMHQKKITQKHYNPIKNTWVRSRVIRGMKLLLHKRIIVTIRIGKGTKYTDAGIFLMLCAACPSYHHGGRLGLDMDQIKV